MGKLGIIALKKEPDASIIQLRTSESDWINFSSVKQNFRKKM